MSAANSMLEATPSMEMTSLIDEFLARQSALSAVEQFSRRHDHAAPARDKYYRELIPATPPGEGQQYAFEVDLDSCSGCKACVTACHSLNGLDEHETWRSVGLLIGGTPQSPVMQHVTSACHHCVDPACMHGCPVLAYEKDEITGIVRHLDDQCIGCQYCILKCPYDVPQYNSRLGIVRKCDMCSGRLAEREAPACAQACPNQAIRIAIVDVERVIEDSEANVFLPGAPEPSYTLPTTSYKTEKGLPRNALPADHYDLAPAHAHLALLVMLVLTQLSAGALAVGQLLAWKLDERVFGAVRPFHALVALVLGMLALGASVLHLGRPHLAYRAVIGWRTSWLSREIMAFGLFALLATAFAGCSVLGGAARPKLLETLGITVAIVGTIGVFCSAMIYHDTQRIFWVARNTVTRFLLTSLLLGLTTLLLAAALGAALSDKIALREVVAGWGRQAYLAVITVSLLKLGFEAMVLRHLWERRYTPMRRTAMLMTGPLLRLTLARFALGLLGGVLLPLLAIGTHTAGAAEFGILLVAVFLMTLGSELLERYLFFTAVAAPKMPGGPA
jgi:Fe-S-cluster-containing dehydrogenase component/DMSO reductase anchor subunit